MLSAFTEDREYVIPELKGFQVGKTYSIVLEDITIEPNKVQGSKGLSGTGLINKSYDDLSPNDKNTVDTAEPAPNYGPRYGDTITVSFRGTGLQENQRINYQDALQFTINNGEIPGFIVGLVRRLFGIELEPNTKFKTTDYFKKGMQFRANIIKPRSPNGRVAIDTKTLELDDGSVSSTAPQGNLSEEAKMLKELISLNKLDDATQFEIFGRLKEWGATEGFKDIRAAWNEIKGNYKK